MRRRIRLQTAMPKFGPVRRCFGRNRCGFDKFDRVSHECSRLAGLSTKLLAWATIIFNARAPLSRSDARFSTQGGDHGREDEPAISDRCSTICSSPADEARRGAGRPTHPVRLSGGGRRTAFGPHSRVGRCGRGRAIARSMPTPRPSGACSARRSRARRGRGDRAGSCRCRSTRRPSPPNSASPRPRLAELGRLRRSFAFEQPSRPRGAASAPAARWRACRSPTG